VVKWRGPVSHRPSAGGHKIQPQCSMWRYSWKLQDKICRRKFEAIKCRRIFAFIADIWHRVCAQDAWFVFRLFQQNTTFLTIFKSVHKKEFTQLKLRDVLMLKLYILHTICRNSDMFRSILFIFRELLSIIKANIKT
jgi:hypothetical protein